MAPKTRKKGKTKEQKDDSKECCCRQCKGDLSGDDVEALSCEICDEWICKECLDIPQEVYKFFEEKTDDFPFICKACKPKLSEIKETLASCQKKIDAVESKQKEDNNRLVAIELQMRELTTANQTQTQTLRDLNNTLGEMKAKTLSAEAFPDLLAANSAEYMKKLTQEFQPTLPTMIRQQMGERDEIEAIKHNLIISGMEENATPEADKEKFIQLMKDEMNLTVEIETAERLGRKQESDKAKLLRVTLKSMKMRKTILSKATSLRQSANDHVKQHLYIRPELTNKQLEESKNLTTLLRAKKKAYPQGKFKIYRGEIIEVIITPTPEVVATPEVNQEEQPAATD